MPSMRFWLTQLAALAIGWAMAVDDDALVQRVEVVLVRQELVAPAQRSDPLGEPDEATVLAGVEPGADGPRRQQRGDDDRERRHRAERRPPGREPVELGVARRREVADSLGGDLVSAPGCGGVLTLGGVLALGRGSSAAARLGRGLVAVGSLGGLGACSSSPAACSASAACSTGEPSASTSTEPGSTYCVKLCQLSLMNAGLAKPDISGERGEDADRDEDELARLVRPVRGRARRRARDRQACSRKPSLSTSWASPVCSACTSWCSPAAAPRGSPKNVRYVARTV